MSSLILFVHVLAAIGLMACLVMELGWMFGGPGRGPDPRARLAQHWRLGRVYTTLGMVILTSGAYLTQTGKLWPAGWPVAAICGMVAMAAMGALAARCAARESLGQSAGQQARARYMPARSAWVRLWLAVGIVFLMTVQPDGWRPWGVLAAAVMAAVATMGMADRAGG